MQISIPKNDRSAKLILSFGTAILLISIALFSYTSNYFLLGIPFAFAIAALVILNWKAYYWLLILAIPLSAEIHLGSFSTTVPDEPMIWVFVPLSMMVMLYNHKQIPAWFSRHPLTLILALQFIWLVVAVIFSQNYFLSLKYLASKIWFLISYLIISSMVIKDKKDIKNIFLLFSIPVMLHAVVVFIWHFFRKFDYWDSNIVVQPFYFNHVDHSTVLSMMFPLMLVAYQLSKNNKRLRRLTLAAILFLIPAIFVTGARAAMLAVIFCLIISFAIRKKLVNFILPAFFIFIASIVFMLSHNYSFVKYRPIMKYTATQRTFEDLMVATFKGTDMSSMERFYRWIAVSRMCQDHPIVGVGPNNFYDHYKAYASSMFKTWVSRNPERSTTHNYFMLVLVEQGWPATILYGILIMAIFAFAQKIYHRTNDLFYKKATMGIVMMLAAGFINNFFSELWDTHKIGFMFYIGILLLMLIDHLSKKEQNLKTLTYN